MRFTVHVQRTGSSGVRPRLPVRPIHRSRGAADPRRIQTAAAWLLLAAGVALAPLSGFYLYTLAGPFGDAWTGPFAESSTGVQVLPHDANGDGTVDTWIYFDGAGLLRLAVDQDRDGVADRWEAYASDGSLERLDRSTPLEDMEPEY